MGKKKQEPVDPNNLKPEDMLKFEIAAELGLADKVVAGGWRCLTAKESGRIGGLITRKKREMAGQKGKNQTLKDEKSYNIGRTTQDGGNKVKIALICFTENGFQMEKRLVKLLEAEGHGPCPWVSGRYAMQAASLLSLIHI